MEVRGPEFEEVKSQLIEAGKWRANLVSLKFFFGNRHKLVKNPQPAGGSEDTMN